MPEVLSVTEILARIYGLGLLASGVALLFDRGLYRRLLREFGDSRALTLLGGLAAFLIGAVTLALHNDLSSGAAILITIIAWISLIEGLFYIAGIAIAHRFFEKITFVRPPVSNVMGGVVVLLGLFLLWAGFAP